MKSRLSPTSYTMSVIFRVGWLNVAVCLALSLCWRSYTCIGIHLRAIWDWQSIDYCYLGNDIVRLALHKSNYSDSDILSAKTISMWCRAANHTQREVYCLQCLWLWWKREQYTILHGSTLPSRVCRCHEYTCLYEFKAPPPPKIHPCY